MKYDKLIESLRYCANEQFIDSDVWCRDCDKMKLDAADALEAADKRIAELEKSYEWKAYAALEESIDGYKTRIAELEAQIHKRGEWISVDDSLPTEKGAYLTAYYYGFVCENYWCLIGKYTVGWVRDEDSVQYWMELPEPPNCGAKMKGEHEDHD